MAKAGNNERERREQKKQCAELTIQGNSIIPHLHVIRYPSGFMSPLWIGYYPSG